MSALDLTLYHSWRSTCSRRVRICLGLKGLAHRLHTLNLRTFEHHRPEYLALNPNGYVPTLVHDGRPLIESTLINEYLDQVCPDVPLRPVQAAELHRMRVWTKFADDVCLPAVVVPTWTDALTASVAGKDAANLDAVLDRIPLPERRARWRKLATTGYTSDDFSEAYAKMRLAVDRMEATLADSPWLAGDRLSLADVNIAPYVWRFREIDPDLVNPRTRPQLADWLDRMLAFPTVHEVLTIVPV